MSCSIALGAPYVPKDDATVLERLPARRDAPAMAELRKLRAALAAKPQDAEAAGTLARRYFDLANAAGDPRYIGYAEAALRPWRGSQAPAGVLYVRALLRQYRHDFDGALEDFARVLEEETEHHGARAWRAAIFISTAPTPCCASRRSGTCSRWRPPSPWRIRSRSRLRRCRSSSCPCGWWSP